MGLSRRMLTHTAAQERLVKTGNVQAPEAYKPAVRGNLQPLSNKTALEYGLTPTKAYAFYTNDTDFKKSDLLTVDGRRFVVRDTTPLTGFGSLDHTTVLLELAA